MIGNKKNSNLNQTLGNLNKFKIPRFLKNKRVAISLLITTISLITTLALVFIQSRKKSLAPGKPRAGKDNTLTTLYTSEGYVSLKKEPSKDSEELNRIPPETQLSFIKQQGNWYQLKYQDTTGWVNSYTVAPPGQEPEFVLGELIVKYKVDALGLPAQQPTNFTELSQKNRIPQSLSQLNNQYPVQSIQKLTPNITTQLQEKLNLLKQKVPSVQNPQAATAINQQIERLQNIINNRNSSPSNKLTNTYLIKFEIPQDSINYDHETQENNQEVNFEPDTFSKFEDPISMLIHNGESIDIKDLETNPKYTELARIKTIISNMKENSNIEYVEPNYILDTPKVPNDPRYSELWAMQKINAEGAWDTTTGSSDIIVADIDTGIDYTHEDLKENIWINWAELTDYANQLIDTNGNGVIDCQDLFDSQNNFINDNDDDDGNNYIDDYCGWDFRNNDNNPMDDSDHGTHTVGTIAAIGNNSKGVVGINWELKIIPLKFLSSSGKGTAAAAINSLKYAADNGANISSNSWSGQGYSKALDDAIDYEHDKGMVVVVAAGNEKSDAYCFAPASSDRAITISASDPDDDYASFTNYGKKIDVAAPGVDILSTIPNNGYETYSGTSMACPHVSGLAALTLSNSPSLTNEQVRQILRLGSDDIGDPGKDKYFGFGRINALKTLQSTSTNPDPLAPIILTPKSRTNLAGNQNIQIKGRIKGSNFHHYVLEIAEGYYDTSNWIELANSTSLDANKEFTLDVNLNNYSLKGEYTIRLTAFDTTDNQYQFRSHKIHLDTGYWENFHDPEPSGFSYATIWNNQLCKSGEHHIYCYQDEVWIPVMSYRGGTGDLITWNDKLCVSLWDSSNVKCFSGSGIETLGGIAQGKYGGVTGMTIWQEKLCAVVTDYLGGSDFIDKVACHNGSDWQVLKELGSPQRLRRKPITVWGNKLCTGLDNGQVECFNGSTWENLGNTGKTVVDLAVWENKLCNANGYFGDDGSTISCYIDNQWQSLFSNDGVVRTITSWNGKLCIGNYNNHVLCYDGNTWEDLGMVEKDGEQSCYIYMGCLDDLTSTQWNGQNSLIVTGCGGLAIPGSLPVQVYRTEGPPASPRPTPPPAAVYLNERTGKPCNQICQEHNLTCFGAGYDDDAENGYMLTTGTYGRCEKYDLLPHDEECTKTINSKGTYDPRCLDNLVNWTNCRCVSIGTTPSPTPTPTPTSTPTPTPTTSLTPTPTSTPTPTPTTSLTPTPTSTPYPTPTTPPEGDNMTIKFKVQAVGGSRSPKKFKAKIRKGSQVLFTDASIDSPADTNGVFTINIDTSSFCSTAGTVDLLIKSNSHLRKKFTDLNLTCGLISFDFTADSTNHLIAGDVNGDNVLDIVDIASILSLYTDLSVPVDPQTPQDINFDGYITIEDIAFTLINFTDIQIPGDE